MIKELRQKLQRSKEPSFEEYWKRWKERFLNGTVEEKFKYAEELKEERKNGTVGS